MKKLFLIGIVGLMLTSCTSKPQVQTHDTIMAIDSTSTCYEDPSNPGTFFVNYDTIIAHIEVKGTQVSVSRVDKVFHSQIPLYQ